MEEPPMSVLQLTDKTTVVAIKDQVFCDLAGEAAILNLRNSKYYGLNPVGARIWEWIQAPATLAALRDRILAEYETDPDRCTADLQVLLTDLAAQDLIEITA